MKSLTQQQITNKQSLHSQISQTTPQSPDVSMMFLGDIMTKTASHTGCRCLSIWHRGSDFTYISQWGGTTHSFLISDSLQSREGLCSGRKGGVRNHLWGEEVSSVFVWKKIQNQNRPYSTNHNFRPQNRHSHISCWKVAALGYVSYSTWLWSWIQNYP